MVSIADNTVFMIKNKDRDTTDFNEYLVYSFPRAVITNYHNLVA